LYIADGHHRTAAACQALLEQQSPKSVSTPTSRKSLVPPPLPSLYLTAMIFPDSQLNVLSYHRCIRSFEGSPVTSSQHFLEILSERFYIEKTSDNYSSPYCCPSSSSSRPGSRLSASSSVSSVELFMDDGVTDIDSNYTRSRCDSNNSNNSRNFTEPPSEEINEIEMFFDNSWYKLSLLHTRNDEESCVIDIDAQILVDHLFKPILNMTYPESENNMIYGKRDGFFIALS
jgi:uncharacterized protein (DUF1015 family)